MTLCDLCYATGPESFGLDYIHAGDPARIISLHLCEKCEKKMVQGIKELVESYRTSSLKAAVPSLTPDQCSQVEAFMMRQRGKS